MSMDLLMAARKRSALPIGFMPGRRNSLADPALGAMLLEVQAKKIVAVPETVESYAAQVQACAISPDGRQIVFGAASNSANPLLAHFSRAGRDWSRSPNPVQPSAAPRTMFFNGTGEFLIILYNAAPWVNLLYFTGTTFTQVPLPFLNAMFDRYVNHVDITPDNSGGYEVVVVGGNTQTGSTKTGGYMKRYRFDSNFATLSERSTPSELADQDWKIKAFYSLDGALLTVLRDTNSYGPRRFYVYSRASDGTLTLQPNGLSEANADMAGSSFAQLVCNAPRDELVTFSNGNTQTMRVYRRSGGVYTSYASANMASIVSLQQYYGLTDYMAYAMSSNLIVAKIENGQITPVPGLRVSSFETQNTMGWFGAVT